MAAASKQSPHPLPCGFDVVVKRILLGFLLFGLLELILLIKAGEAFGTLFPVVAVLLSMAAGALVIRHYGLQALNRLGGNPRTGLPPAEPASAGLAGVLAGILLIFPGFLSDFLAILLLIPAARRIVASMIGLRSRFGVALRRDGANGPVIDAEAVEIRGEVIAKQHPSAAPLSRR
jgi:UPF0716 protein FxsA